MVAAAHANPRSYRRAAGHRACGTFPHPQTTGGFPVGKTGQRIAVTLACQDCKRRNYQSNKSRRNTPDRVSLSKYCRWCGRHTEHRETR